VRGRGPRSATVNVLHTLVEQGRESASRKELNLRAADCWGGGIGKTRETKGGQDRAVALEEEGGSVDSAHQKYKQGRKKRLRVN